MWSKSVHDNFHLAITAFVDANGFVITSMSFFPGLKLIWDVTDKCTIEGIFISVAQKVFMNSRIFIKWFEHFYNSVPTIVKILLVLFYDGQLQHYNNYIVEKYMDISIIFVLLSDNSNHLIQLTTIELKVCL